MADMLAARRPGEPSFVDLFTPKLVTVLREGYGARDLQADAIAGLTVAIVALPLSMAIAVASGVTPDRGLYTAIIGGFLVSLLGGSRFQIGGPAGAFIVLVNLTVQRHGYDGLVLATCMAGLMMIAIGLLRLGAYIKYIPYPVTVGFTAGIGIIILASQVKDVLGLAIASEPAAIIAKLAAIAAAIGTANPATASVGGLCIGIILVLRRLRPAAPGFLIAIAIAAAITAVLQLDIETLGGRFGAAPSGLPAPSFPAVSLAKVQAVLPDAIAIALLGSIESLLSAVVADGMSGRRHRSNCELVAQGAANIGSVLFGGICVTGTIARTATNVRAGAKGPVAGLFHAVYILAFLLIASPLVAYVPLAALGAVLIVVAWNMIERDEMLSLMRSSRGDAVVLMATFLLTVFFDLTIAIGAGVVIGSFLFMRRMEEAVEVETGSDKGLVGDDRSDYAGSRTRYDAAAATDRNVVVFRISGAFFFGATARVSAILDRLGEHPPVFVLDFSDVPFIDSTAAKALESFAHKLRRSGTKVYFAGAQRSVRRALLNAGLRRPLVRYADTVETAKSLARSEADPGA